MSDLLSSLHNMRRMDDLARQSTWIHRLHPAAKLAVTAVYLLILASTGRYEIVSLFPFLLYPVLVTVMADLPAALLIKRLLLVEPLILGIGLLNPLFDRQAVLIGFWTISRGWLVFASLTLKGTLTIYAALLLAATTRLDDLALALRALRIPRLLVVQVVMIWRYLEVLGMEVAKTQRAYQLRAPKHHGIRPSAWGSLLGQIILRTYDRAGRIDQAMRLRGFQGDFPDAGRPRWHKSDFLYIGFWLSFFIIARWLDLPAMLGSWAAGGLL